MNMFGMLSHAVFTLEHHMQHRTRRMMTRAGKLSSLELAAIAAGSMFRCSKAPDAERRGREGGKRPREGGKEENGGRKRERERERGREREREGRK